MSKLDVYHACSSRGGSQVVLDNSPFCSDQKRQHWLTEGFYFWRSAKHAESWGKDSHTCDTYDYAMIKASFEFADNELLDLVSNPDQMDFFRKLLSRYINLMRGKTGKFFEPTISACVEHFRELSKTHIEIFPFKAIMATEEAKRPVNVKFVEHRDNTIALNNKIQICVFEKHKNMIVDKELLHPK